LTRLSVATVIRRMLDYAARPLSEFNKYKAIDILKTLQNTSWDNQDEKREFYRSCRKGGKRDEHRGPMVWLVSPWAE